jgi:hypothetical protein
LTALPPLGVASVVVGVVASVSVDGEVVVVVVVTVSVDNSNPGMGLATGSGSGAARMASVVAMSTVIKCSECMMSSLSLLIGLV